MDRSCSGSCTESDVDYFGNIAISGNKVVVASDENAYSYILEECA